MREYAEDTVFRSLVSSTTIFSSRRRTLFLFHTSDKLPSPMLIVDNTKEVWENVRDALETIQPKKIAVNVWLLTTPSKTIVAQAYTMIGR